MNNCPKPLKQAENDLHASDGRDTEALNCKPITNL
jgi:hypothetical protein